MSHVTILAASVHIGPLEYEYKDFVTRIYFSCMVSKFPKSIKVFVFLEMYYDSYQISI